MQHVVLIVLICVGMIVGIIHFLTFQRYQVRTVVTIKQKRLPVSVKGKSREKWFLAKATIYGETKFFWISEDEKNKLSTQTETPCVVEWWGSAIWTGTLKVV